MKSYIVEIESLEKEVDFIKNMIKNNGNIPELVMLLEDKVKRIEEIGRLIFE